MSVVSFSGGANNAPHLLKPGLENEIALEVLGGEFGTGGTEQLSNLLSEIGASQRGYLAVYLCPYGTKTKRLSGTSERYFIYEKTIPVWVVRSDGLPSNHPSVCQLKKLRTSEFVRWIVENVLKRPSFSRGSPLERIEESFQAPFASRPDGLLPQDSISCVAPRNTPRNIPPPSLVGYRSERAIPPPSQVNSVTGDHPSYIDGLNLAEAEFRDTPRIRDSQGNLAFDPTEYIRRINNLDAQRASKGLPPVSGNPTPSTYTR